MERHKQESLDVLREEILKLKTIIEEKDFEIKILRGSTSWKITAPLRMIMKNINKLNNLKKKIEHMIKKSLCKFNIFIKSIIYITKEFNGMFNLCNNTFKQIKINGFLFTISKIYSRIFAGPLITVITPIYNTPTNYLEDCIKSVLNQVYSNWQLILVDDLSTNEKVREIMSIYEKKDKRITCVYRVRNGHISKAINSGLERSKGEFFTILDHDDILSPLALYYVAEQIIKTPSVDFIYTDENKLSEDGMTFFEDFYKPDWSPEYLLSVMYTCHMSVFRTQIAKKIGGFKSEFDGAQDYDFTLRFVAKTNSIIHIPKVLYHWRIWANSCAEAAVAKPYAFERQKKAISSHLAEFNQEHFFKKNIVPGFNRIYFKPKSHDKISIVIPTNNHEIKSDHENKKCIDILISSIFSSTSYENYEIIIVHDGNLTNDQIICFNERQNIRLIHSKENDLSIPQKINLGCEHASGDYLLVLNEKIKVITENWLEHILGIAQRDGVGVVGCRILFSDKKIMHAGITLLKGKPYNPYFKEPENTYGYGGGAFVVKNYLVVSGYCHMTSKKLYNEVGGYNTDKYAKYLYDVDYCLKLHELGYRAVSLPEVKFIYHKKSKDVNLPSGNKFERELKSFKKEWKNTYPNDPYYNINLNQHIPFA